MNLKKGLLILTVAFSIVACQKEEDTLVSADATELSSVEISADDTTADAVAGTKGAPSSARVTSNTTTFRTYFFTYTGNHIGYLHWSLHSFNSPQVRVIIDITEAGITRRRVDETYTSQENYNIGLNSFLNHSYDNRANNDEAKISSIRLISIPLDADGNEIGPYERQSITLDDLKPSRIGQQSPLAEPSPVAPEATEAATTTTEAATETTQEGNTAAQTGTEGGSEAEEGGESEVPVPDVEEEDDLRAQLIALINSIVQGRYHVAIPDGELGPGTSIQVSSGSVFFNARVNQFNLDGSGRNTKVAVAKLRHQIVADVLEAVVPAGNYVIEYAKTTLNSGSEARVSLGSQSVTFRVNADNLTGTLRNFKNALATLSSITAGGHAVVPGRTSVAVNVVKWDGSRGRLTVTAPAEWYDAITDQANTEAYEIIRIGGLNGRSVRVSFLRGIQLSNGNYTFQLNLAGSIVGTGWGRPGTELFLRIQ